MTNFYHQAEAVDHLEDVMKPPIYSKRAIRVFSIFFSSIFGGVLLMQNLRSIGKKREGNIVFLIAFAMTIVTAVIIVVFDIKNNFFGIACNIGWAIILTEYFEKKYFPDEAEYEKKKIWKPLIIGIAICVAFILLAVLGARQLQ